MPLLWILDMVWTGLTCWKSNRTYYFLGRPKKEGMSLFTFFDLSNHLGRLPFLGVELLLPFRQSYSYGGVGLDLILGASIRHFWCCYYRLHFRHLIIYIEPLFVLHCIAFVFSWFCRTGIRGAVLVDWFDSL